MLGHKLWQVMSHHADTFVTFRQTPPTYDNYQLFDTSRAVSFVSAQDFDSISKAFAFVRPTVVINCIGIVKQGSAAKDPLMSISINGLFPHRLALLCQASGVRLVHISTDCVFSGRKGGYRENDVADAEDLYGRTKYLGEVGSDGCLTLRTSMIGRELQGTHGLIEWFLSQGGKTISGYTQAVFSGFTTQALAEIIVKLVTEQPGMNGVWHLAAEPINKFELLTLVKRIYNLDIQINPDETFFCDRSLDANRLRQATGLVAPTWHDMIEQMYQDTTPYDELLRRN